MEVHAQRLGMAEDPAPQIEEHVLVDPGRGADVGVLEDAGPGGTEEIADGDGDQRAVVVGTERGYAPVDGVRDEQRPRLHRRLLEQQEQRGEGDPAAPGAQQRPEQRAGGSGRGGQGVLGERIVIPGGGQMLGGGGRVGR